MYQNDETDEAEDDQADHEDEPAIQDIAATSASRTSERATNTNFFDEFIGHHSQQPLPASSYGRLRRSQFPSSSSVCVGAAPSQQPRAVLDLDVLQQQAEALEQQTRKYMDDTQKQAERHYEEMLDTKVFRVTHACEHCRQRKAKCSGQQPCQRCANQSILCVYSKHDRKGKQVRPLQTFEELPSQSMSRYRRQMHLPPVASVGPIRKETRRGGRNAGIAVPYGPRKTTVPCMPLGSNLSTSEGQPGSSSFIMPPPLSSSHSLLPPTRDSGLLPPLPPTSRELRDEGQFYAGHPSSPFPSLWPSLNPEPEPRRSSYVGQERRESIISEASGSLVYGPNPGPQTPQPESPQVSRPWSIQSTFPPADETQLTSSLPLRYSDFPARTWPPPPLSSPSGSNVWMGEPQIQRAVASSFGPASHFQYPLAVQYQQHMTGVGLQERGRHSSWSQEDRLGSGSTEAGQSNTSDPATLETVQAPIYPESESYVPQSSSGPGRLQGAPLPRPQRPPHAEDSDPPFPPSDPRWSLP